MTSSEHVLIVAPAAQASTLTAVAAELQVPFTSAPSAAAAAELIDSHEFTMIAVAQRPDTRQLVDALERRHPLTRLVTLSGDDDASQFRRLLRRYVQPSHPQLPLPDGTVLQEALDVLTRNSARDAMRDFVRIAREHLHADRAWLLAPVHEEAEFAKLIAASSTPGDQRTFDNSTPAPLTASRQLIVDALESPMPLRVTAGDPRLDSSLAAHWQIGSAMMQIVRPKMGEPIAFGIHSADPDRTWSDADLSLFTHLGRLIRITATNTALHERSMRDAARVTALLDQMPEAAALYDREGVLERMNDAARRNPQLLCPPDPQLIVVDPLHRYLDGRPLSSSELPSVRAARGETVRADYLLHDERSGADRIINLKAAPIRDRRQKIIGSVVSGHDITEERQESERDQLRRRRSESLGRLGFETAVVSPAFDQLDEVARVIAEAINGTAMIYTYQHGSGELHMVGLYSCEATAPEFDAFRAYLTEAPYHPGEGVPGAVFQIGTPLLFSDARDAIRDFARSDEERRIILAMKEQTLIACPIESYGERIGSLVIARTENRRAFDAEDLEYARAVADRIGTASRVHRLTRIAMEGHRAAEELARHEVDARLRLEAVLDNAPVGIAVISADELRIELANVRWLEYASLFGRVTTDSTVVGTPIDEIIPGFDAVVERVADSGTTRIDQAVRIQHQGGELFFDRIISPVRGRFSGATQSLTMLVQDVTEPLKSRLEVEALAQMMAERSARLDSILRSMTDAVWVYDASGELVDINPAAVSLFGLGSRADAVARGSLREMNLRYPDGRAIPFDLYPQIRALTGESIPDYLAIGRHLLEETDLDLSIAAAPIESNGIVGAVLVMRDITALQELDRKKDEFLSVASHELRTPLTTIKGYTQLLQQTANDLDPDDRNTYISAVLGEIERMMGLISELLDVSRIETKRLQIHPASVAWLDFIQRRAGAFRVQNHDREIRFTTRCGELTIEVDPDRMRQVIDNLLSNALKYSPDGSPIDVEVWTEDDVVATAVIDHGIGIPQDELTRLFERFHRARNVSSRYYGGLGLGLYIARAIVQAHGGSLDVESEEGRGSRFTLRLTRVALGDTAS